MKITTFFLIAFCLHVSAKSDAQKVTLDLTNASLEQVFEKIQSQTSFNFFFNEALLSKAKRVTVKVKDATIEDVLTLCFKDQPLLYSISDNSVVVKQKPGVPAANVTSETPPPTIDIRGRITDEDGMPIPGITVTVKETNAATPTDANGNYLLKDVDANATLVISGVNVETMELRVKGRALINAQLNKKIKELDAPIIVAYTSTSQRSNTASVSVVKGDVIQSLPSRSFEKSLQGLVPGLQITTGSGQPGGGVANIVLRGISTGTDPFFGSTVRNPLFVIDGMPVSQDGYSVYSNRSTTAITNPLSQINPSDIETITVLKDAAAIALYGSKASNGVILVTTKRGNSGSVSFTFRHQTDFSKRLKGELQLLDRTQYLELLYETYKNTPRNPSPWTDQLIKSDLLSKYPYLINAPGDSSFYPVSDWIGEVYENDAITIANELSISGGGEKNNFYLNFEYSKQNGVIRKTGYDRKSIRFNYDLRPSRNIKLGINTLLSHNTQDYNYSAVNALNYSSTLYPIRNSEGVLFDNFSFPFITANPLSEIEYNVNQTVSYRSLIKLFAEAKLFKYFSLSTNIGIDFMLAEENRKQDPRLSGEVPIGIGSIYNSDTKRMNLISTNLLKYDRKISKHSISALLGMEAQTMNQKSLFGQAIGTASAPPLPYYDQISSPGYNMNGLSGYRLKQSMLSYFSQGNYDYKNKYLVSGSYRMDGSSRFGDNNKWGKFWSIGGGWVVSSEKFMKNISKVVPYLKVRGSFGSAGSSAAVGAVSRYDVLTIRNFYNNTALVPSTYPGNPAIKWEQTYNSDLGLEARFWHERFSINADVYKRNTSNLIYLSNLPSTSGFANVLNNIGDMRNTGIELAITVVPIKSKNVNWVISANWSTNNNTLIKANLPLAAISGNLLANEEGRNFNSFYLRQWAGVDPTSGAPLWIDSTGKANSNYSAAKRSFVGKPQPDGYGALTNSIAIKNFELSARVYYQYGSLIYDYNSFLSDGAYPYQNQSKESLNRWTKPGDIALNPKRTLGNSSNSTLESTRFLSKGDYVRLANVSLSYNFDKEALTRFGINKIRLFIQGNNLATWSNFSGQDPDNANVEGAIASPYPVQKNYSIGVNVEF